MARSVAANDTFFELARHMAEVTPITLLTFGEREMNECAGRPRIHVLGNPWYVRGQRFNRLAWRMLRELRTTDANSLPSAAHPGKQRRRAAFARLTGRRVFVSDLGGGGWDIPAYVSTDRWFNGHLHISEYSRTIAGHRGKPWAHIILGGVDAGSFTEPVRSARQDRAFRGSVATPQENQLPHRGPTSGLATRSRASA